MTSHADMNDHIRLHFKDMPIYGEIGRMREETGKKFEIATHRVYTVVTHSHCGCSAEFRYKYQMIDMYFPSHASVAGWIK